MQSPVIVSCSKYMKDVEIHFQVKLQMLWKRGALGNGLYSSLQALLPRVLSFSLLGFFTTPALCIALREMDIWITGTAMKHKQGMDTHTQFKKTKNVERGFFKWVYDKAQRICQICWLDRMPVLLVTNIFGPVRGEGVRRLTVDLAGKFARLLMRAPLAAQFYNLYMGGVDAFDRLKLNR